MKIIAIRLRNLASIEGTYEIDFTVEPLLSTGIFAISGPTGSGKSTILDALCLALFDKAPRFAATSEKVTLSDVGEERIQQTDVRNILRRGTGEGFAEVDFVGVDNRRYSSRWTVYRARRKPTGALQNQILAVKNIDTDEPLQGTKTELLNRLSALIGLTYEQFTRTVLLAQNDFATFLKSRDDAKAELLEKLTGTEIYSRISMTVFARNKEAQNRLSELQFRVGEVSLLSDEELAELKIQKKNREKEKSDRQETVRLLEQKQLWNEQCCILQQNYNQADAALKVSEKALSDASERITLLSRVDSVQGARRLVIERGNQEQSLSTQKQQLQKTMKELAKKNASLLRQHQSHSGLEDKLKAIQSEVQKTNPLIVQARALDIRLAEAGKSLFKAEQDFLKAENEQKTTKEAYDFKNKQLDDLTSRMKTLKDWIVRYEPHAAMIAKTDYVYSLLDKGESLNKKLQDSESVLKQLDHTLQISKEALDTLNNAGMVAAKHLDNLKNDQDALLLQLEDVQIESVRKKVEGLLALKEKLVEAGRLKSICEAEEKELIRWKEKQAEWRQELLVKTDEVIRLAEDIRLKKGQLEIVRRMHDNAQLALSENVAQLRQSLQTGNPCPVCGSTGHPYLVDKKTDLVLKEVLKAFNDLTKELEELHHRNISLTKDKDYLGERLKESETEIKKCVQTKDEHRSLFACLTDGLSVEISLSDQLKEVVAQLDAKKKQEADYAELTKRAKTIEQQVKSLQIENEKNKESVRGQEQAYRTLLAEREKEMALREQQQVSYMEIVHSVGMEISITDWQNLWVENPGTFREQLQKLHRLWTEKHTEQEQVQLEYRQLTADLEGDAKLLQSLTGIVAKAQKMAEDIRLSFERLKAERMTLLSGRSADEAEQQYKSLLQQAQEERDASVKKLTDFATLCSELEGQIKQLELDNRKHEQELANRQLDIQQWLNKYNESNASKLEESELLDLLSKDADWIIAERRMMNELHHTCTKAKATLEERGMQLTKHLQDRSEMMLDVDDLRQIAETINKEKQRLEAIEKELFEFHSRLLMQQQNKQRLKDFEKELKEKQEVANRWAKLNDLIGQASGEKFKIIAQGYTLGVLLRHANKHLSYLSSRYKLQQVSGSLALQVIDRDMCDEIRTVYSLSGGESFLISLALALGLSSFSSKNMKVESLFIDEGFGSLDADSLRMAMDALEQLQTQGRKIGVISHVREMSERISTQIVLSRTANGRSKVAVTGR